MTIEQIHREVHRMGAWAGSIRGITLHNPAEHHLAIKLYDDIIELDEAVKRFHRKEVPILAKETGFDLHRVGIDATRLSSSHSGEVHARIRKIFGILNRMPREAIRREEPILIKAFESGLRAKANG